ncbi:NADH-quinone oxidoreductase subunit NuoN [Pseudochelatococcus contaminans]|uniref:NADH-quinone oxidoreductase subunit N n=1 Tax=Pseudochelatococcus contaminans TaxID=1538103 RepID=A0A7W5Z271_9HYPH|nr:NADH-quinone oxidoreductase subunit NuoN [Pseudochelatococcus contaminans]MBB3808472.1 NADH-quinone oxidoreductase subunit N [Pseudochelatococcus contaminans]
MTSVNLPALGVVLPELLLAVGALVLVLVGALRGERSSGLVNVLALVLIVLSAIAVAAQGSETVVAFNDSFIVDGFARFWKILALIGSAVAIVLSRDFFIREGLDKFEFPVLVLLSTLGMLMMISANSLLTLYVGLELQSLAIYVIAAFDRDNTRSTEAGLKYFVLGALSSGMLLYGSSLVYGLTGSVNFAAIAAAVQGEQGVLFIFGLVFIIAGLAFKISAVPFHMWTPDVYEGAPTPVTAFLAAAPKMAAMALTVRVLVGVFPGIFEQWQQIILFVSVASMAIGSFAAIGQRSIKRLMAYSSIGHMGYALVGLAAGTEQGVQAVLIYMAIYLATTLGAFAGILALRNGNVYVDRIEDLAGLSRSQPALAFFFAMLFFSLAGIPPWAGFFAKLYVFSAAIEAGLYTLAIIGVLLSVVGAFYYLRIVKIIYFDEAKTPYEPMTSGLKFVLGVSSVVVLLFWVLPAPLVGSAVVAAKSLF